MYQRKWLGGGKTNWVRISADEALHLASVVLGAFTTRGLMDARLAQGDIATGKFTLRVKPDTKGV